jgi:hypothetical protein
VVIYGLAGARSAFRGARSGKSSQFLFDRLKRFCAEPQELYADAYTKEAIADFTISLDFDIGRRQAKSQIYDGKFPDNVSKYLRRSREG